MWKLKGQLLSLFLLFTILTVENFCQTTPAAGRCEDDAASNCWSRPDSDCGGIYEPWSRAHCPLRCGYCPGQSPPCEDKLVYCGQFEDNVCTETSYRVWARVNCRKHCNLCVNNGAQMLTYLKTATWNLPNQAPAVPCRCALQESHHTKRPPPSLARLSNILTSLLWSV